MSEITHKMGIEEHLLDPHGSELAKIRLDAIDELRDRPKAKYMVVAAITRVDLDDDGDILGSRERVHPGWARLLDGTPLRDETVARLPERHGIETAGFRAV